ncbi:MAG: type II toxin-antitoxin system HicA family toxin [Stellaceae bacterium]
MASLSYRELRRLLEEHGCRSVRNARHGGHEIWHCPGGKVLSVPQNLRGEGTLLNILKAAGITRTKDR